MGVMHFNSTQERIRYLRGGFEEIVPIEVTEEPIVAEKTENEPLKAENDEKTAKKRSNGKKRTRKKKEADDDEIQAE